ncbi:MAG: hypothetical protein HKO57_14590, partial [Akkermansiaceae bacterium]|nr:hypothetical protein [Akkermansiaceae bacterium]
MPRTLRPAPPLRPVDLPLAPSEVAAGLRHLPGLVFFDTAGHLAGHSPQPLSLVAARPVEVVRGDLADPSALRASLEARRHDRADCGFPLGAACGMIDYDGRFAFGIYEDLLVFHHGSSRWFEVGSLAADLHPLAVPPVPDLGAWRSNFTRDEFTAAVRT